MNKDDYNNLIINDAVELLAKDGVIVVATDTVYGIACSSKSEIAKDKIYEIKKQNSDKKLPIIVDSYGRLKSMFIISDQTLRRLKTFFPGKVSVILKLKDSEETVAVRMINNEIINRIIEKLDCSLYLTSANISGKNNYNDIDRIIDEFDGKVDMIILGKNMSNNCSTIIDVTNEKEIKLVREGSVSFEKIKEVYYRG